MLAQFLPTDPPPAGNWFYPMFWPWVLASLGAYLYFKALKMESYGSKAPYKFAAIPLCVVAILWGCLPLYVYLTDFVYRDVIFSGRVKLAHFLAPFGGIVALASILVYRQVKLSSQRRHDFIDSLVR